MKQLPVDFDPATGVAKMRHVDSWIPFPAGVEPKPSGH